MHWLSNMSHPERIPKSKTRLPLPGTLRSVFYPIILTAKKATAGLYQDSQRSWATPRQGHGAEQALWTHPKVHHPGCPLLTYSAVLSFPWGRAEVPGPLHGFVPDSIREVLIPRWLVTEVCFQTSEDKAWPCQTASQFLWQLSTAAWLEPVNAPSPGQAASAWQCCRGSYGLCRTDPISGERLVALFWITRIPQPSPISNLYNRRGSPCPQSTGGSNAADRLRLPQGTTASPGPSPDNSSLQTNNPRVIF